MAEVVPCPSLGAAGADTSCPTADIGEAVAYCLFTVPIRWPALKMELV